MSGFMGPTAGQTGIGIPCAKDDQRHFGEQYDNDFYSFINVDNIYAQDGYAGQYWPGATGLDASGGEWLRGIWFDRPEVNTGAVSKRGFSGYTRDVNGVAIAGVTLRLFRTSDSQLTSQVLSDAQGFFTLDTQFYPDTHFYTAHKADVPEIAGASPSTLVAG